MEILSINHASRACKIANLAARYDVKREQLQNTRPRLRDSERLLPQSRGRVLIGKGKICILWVNEHKTSKSIAPAVPQWNKINIKWL